ncbi:MAG: hypothetical protein AABW63_01080, partial [Nanoarchaeota archaeon]
MKRGLVVLLAVIFVFGILESVSGATLEPPKISTITDERYNFQPPKTLANAATSPNAVECGSIPTSGCFVTTSTTFIRGIYSLPEGIWIEANNTVLDCNGSTISTEGNPAARGVYIGDDLNNDLMNYSPLKNITVKNCIFKNFSSVWSTDYNRQILIQNNTFVGPNSRFFVYHACDVNIVQNNFTTGDIQFHSDLKNLTGCSYPALVENNTKIGYMSLIGIQNLQNLPVIIRGNSFGALEMHQSTPTKIYNNTFINDNYNLHMGGLGPDDNSNIDIYNNIFYNSNPSCISGACDAITFFMDNGTRSNISVYNNSISGFNGGILFFIGSSNNYTAKNIKIYNNQIYNNYAGILEYNLIASGEIYVYANNITNNSVGIWLPSDPIQNQSKVHFFLNNLYNNSQFDIYGQYQREISYQKQGNYWGHTTPPCFDSNFLAKDTSWAEIVDSYPYCGSAPSNAVIIPMSSPA